MTKKILPLGLLLVLLPFSLGLYFLFFLVVFFISFLLELGALVWRLAHLKIILSRLFVSLILKSGVYYQRLTQNEGKINHA